MKVDLKDKAQGRSTTIKKRAKNREWGRIQSEKRAERKREKKLALKLKEKEDKEAPATSD